MKPQYYIDSDYWQRIYNGILALEEALKRSTEAANEVSLAFGSAFRPEFEATPEKVADPVAPGRNPDRVRVSQIPKGWRIAEETDLLVSGKKTVRRAFEEGESSKFFCEPYESYGAADITYIVPISEEAGE
jgi:hypothetical protein